MICSRNFPVDITVPRHPGHPSERKLGNFLVFISPGIINFVSTWKSVWIRKIHVAMAQPLGIKGTIDLDKLPEMESCRVTSQYIHSPSRNHWDMNGQELCWWANALGPACSAKQVVQEIDMDESQKWSEHPSISYLLTGCLYGIWRDSGFWDILISTFIKISRKPLPGYWYQQATPQSSVHQRKLLWWRNLKHPPKNHQIT